MKVSKETKVTFRPERLSKNEKKKISRNILIINKKFHENTVVSYGSIRLGVQVEILPHPGAVLKCCFDQGRSLGRSLIHTEH